MRSFVHDVWSRVDCYIHLPFSPDRSVLDGIWGREGGNGGGWWTQSYHPLLARKYVNKLRFSYLVPQVLYYYCGHNTRHGSKFISVLKTQPPHHSSLVVSTKKWSPDAYIICELFPANHKKLPPRPRTRYHLSIVWTATTPNNTMIFSNDQDQKSCFRQ